MKHLVVRSGKSEDGVSLWVRRVMERKLEDRDFAEDAEALDFEMSEER